LLNYNKKAVKWQIKSATSKLATELSLSLFDKTIEIWINCKIRTLKTEYLLINGYYRTFKRFGKNPKKWR